MYTCAYVSYCAVTYYSARHTAHLCAGRAHVASCNLVQIALTLCIVNVWFLSGFIFLVRSPLFYLFTMYSARILSYSDPRRVCTYMIHTRSFNVKEIGGGVYALSVAPRSRCVLRGVFIRPSHRPVCTSASWGVFTSSLVSASYVLSCGAIDTGPPENSIKILE